MRAVLVVAKDQIDLVGRMLNKNNVEVVGMVVDDRPFIIEHGCPKNRAFAFWQLKDAVELTSPDYVLFFLPRQTPVNSFHAQLNEAKFPLDKTCMMYNFSDDEVLTHQRMIRGFQKDSQQYKIIAAGNSGIYFGISPEEFELPVWNFAYYSQDLYYDYQIIKRALQIEDVSESKICIDTKTAPPPPKKFAKIDHNIKYAIIGLPPYILHFDLSLSKDGLSLLRNYQYFFALNDQHNSGIDASTLRKILNPNFIQDMEKQSLEKDYVCKSRAFSRTFNLNDALNAWNVMTAWDRKNYPATVVEYKKIFRDYLRLLDDNSIYPILVFLPSVKEYYKRFNHDKVNELLDFLNDLRCDYRFTFVNLWAMEDMFNDYDFHDIYHLNQKGSKKFSAFLNRIVMEMEGVK